MRDRGVDLLWSLRLCQRVHALLVAIVAFTQVVMAQDRSAAARFCRPISEHGCVSEPAYSPGLNYRPASVAELVQHPEAFVGLTVLVTGDFEFAGTVDGKTYGAIKRHPTKDSTEWIAVDAAAFPSEDREKCYVELGSSATPCKGAILLGVVKDEGDGFVIVASELSVQ